MKRIKYLFQRILQMDYKEMFKTIDKISTKTKKSKIITFFDMVICGIVHQAGYVDYDFYNMYNLNHNERKTIMTRGKNNYYVKKLNPKEYWHYFDNKNEFNFKFKKYLNRDWMYIENDNFSEFEKFIKKHNEFIVKPNNLSCGKGVRKITVNDSNIKSLYKELIDNQTYLLEEIALQHQDMNALHPYSVNTIRIVTLISDYGKVSVISAVVRIGTNKKVVDNFNNGGICAMIDLNTGKINSVGIDSSGKKYKNHPTTKIELEGYQIPMWDDVKKLVCEAAKVVKEMRLIGWDVCIGPVNPCLIEANQFPAHDLYQPLFGENDKIGIVPAFEEAINKK